MNYVVDEQADCWRGQLRILPIFPDKLRMAEIKPADVRGRLERARDRG
jgi:hypothetical protein